LNFVLWLTSEEAQKRAIAMGLGALPTRQSLYHSLEAGEDAGFMQRMQAIFPTAIARPSAVTGVRYAEVSEACWNSVHRNLAGDATPEQAVHVLAKDLNTIK
jgi:trehalose/maltose transport system substrate-binding protein